MFYDKKKSQKKFRYSPDLVQTVSLGTMTHKHSESWWDEWWFDASAPSSGKVFPGVRDLVAVANTLAPQAISDRLVSIAEQQHADESYIDGLGFMPNRTPNAVLVDVSLQFDLWRARLSYQRQQVQGVDMAGRTLPVVPTSPKSPLGSRLSALTIPVSRFGKGRSSLTHLFLRGRPGGTLRNRGDFQGWPAEPWPRWHQWTMPLPSCLVRMRWFKHLFAHIYLGHTAEETKLVRSGGWGVRVRS